MPKYVHLLSPSHPFIEVDTTASIVETRPMDGGGKLFKHLPLSIVNLVSFIQAVVQAFMNGAAGLKEWA